MSGRPPLIVIGASYLQLPVILEARELGLETHVFAWEEGAVARDEADHFYPISIVEIDEILAAARSIAPAGILSIASDLAMVTVNRVATELGLVGNSLACTEATTNKHRMREVLAAAGLPCPGFRRVISPDDRPEGLRPPLIVKPTDRSGSRGVTRLDSAEGTAAAIERALGESMVGEAIVEEYLEGEELSVEMISFKGEHHYLAATAKETTGAPHFVETGHHQPAGLSPDVEGRVVAAVTAALDALGVENGASHSELMLGADGEMGIIEVGARMGGDFIGSDLVELSTGYDFLEGVIDVALDRFTAPEKKWSKYAGVRFLCPPGEGVVGRVVDNRARHPEIVRSEIHVAPGDAVTPVRESAERKGYYIYQSDEGPLVPGPDPVFKIDIG